MENKISIQIPPAELDAVLTAANTIVTKLEPFIMALTPQERSSLPKMGQISIPFVQSTAAYFETNPEFAPPFISVTELKKDFNSANDLTRVYKTLDQVMQNLSDTIMLCGSEALVACLSYYNSVKQAAKINIPNAKPIVEDLKQRFQNNGPAVTSEPTPVPAE